MSRLLILASVLAACGGGAKQVDTTPVKAGAPACEKMADHLVGLMKQGAAAGAPQEASDRITQVLIERCTVDGWSIAAQQCFLGVATLEESDRCAPMLTVPQRDAADRAMKDAFPEAAGAAAGSPGGAPPPPAS